MLFHWPQNSCVHTHGDDDLPQRGGVVAGGVCCRPARLTMMGTDLVVAGDTSSHLERACMRSDESNQEYKSPASEDSGLGMSGGEAAPRMSSRPRKAKTVQFSRSLVEHEPFHS